MLHRFMTNHRQSIRASIWAYERLLALYPPAFRNRFGPEMADAFEQILQERIAADGPRGVFLAWRMVLRELIPTLFSQLASEYAGAFQKHCQAGRLGASLRIVAAAAPPLVGWALLFRFSQRLDEMVVITLWLSGVAIGLLMTRARGPASLWAAVACGVAGLIVPMLGSWLLPWSIDVPLAALPLLTAVGCTAALVLAAYARLIIEGITLRPHCSDFALA